MHWWLGRLYLVDIQKGAPEELARALGPKLDGGLGIIKVVKPGETVSKFGPSREKSRALKTFFKLFFLSQEQMLEAQFSGLVRWAQQPEHCQYGGPWKPIKSLQLHPLTM